MSSTPERSEVQASQELEVTEVVRGRDSAYWAKPVTRLDVAAVPAEAINLNVAGRRPLSPMQGFGQLWQKTYRVRIGAGASPTEVIKTWKQNFPHFWPRGNRFFGPLTGIAPGEVAVLNLPVLPGPVPLSTGIMVMYADDESFTFMTPEGHMFAGWITFSAYEDGGTVAQVQVLIRANDPLWEVSMHLFGFKKEDEFWRGTLENVAAHFGVQGEVEMQAVCVDRRWQWGKVGNIWHNAAIRSSLYGTTAPLRWMGRLGRREKKTVKGNG